MLRASRKEKKKKKQSSQKKSSQSQQSNAYSSITTQDALNNLQAPQSILHLQRIMGNQGVQRLLQSNQENPIQRWVEGKISEQDNWVDGNIPEQGDNVAEDNQLAPETAQGIDRALRVMVGRLYNNLLRDAVVSANYENNVTPDVLANQILGNLYTYQGVLPAIDSLIRDVEDFCEAYYSLLFSEFPEYDSYSEAQQRSYEKDKEKSDESFALLDNLDKLSDNLPKFIKNRKAKKLKSKYDKKREKLDGESANLQVDTDDLHSQLSQVMSDHMGFGTSLQSMRDTYTEIRTQLLNPLADHQLEAVSQAALLNDTDYENRVGRIIMVRNTAAGIVDLAFQ